LFLVLNITYSVCSIVYLIDPSEPPTPPSSIIDEPLVQTSNRNDSILIHHDETNQNDLSVESVRSQKSTTRGTSSPIPTRFSTPPQSTRREQLSQSVTIPYSRSSPSIDQQMRYGKKVKFSFK
jgi:hypothetical protein